MKKIRENFVCPRAKPGFHWGSHFDRVHHPLPTLDDSTRLDPTRKSHHSVNFSANLGPSGHVLGSQRPQYIKSDAKKVRAVPQGGDLTVQRACAKSRMALINRFEW